jgi:hypothetical protein
LNSFPHYPAIHSDAWLACDRSVPLPPLLPPLKKAHDVSEIYFAAVH